MKRYDFEFFQFATDKHEFRMVAKLTIDFYNNEDSGMGLEIMAQKFMDAIPCEGVNVYHDGKLVAKIGDDSVVD